MSAPTIAYRCPPVYLSTSQIVAELIWIGDAVRWAGPLGDYARGRRDALRAELRRRRAS